MKKNILVLPLLLVSSLFLSSCDDEDVEYQSKKKNVNLLTLDFTNVIGLPEYQEDLPNKDIDISFNIDGYDFLSQNCYLDKGEKNYIVLASESYSSYFTTEGALSYISLSTPINGSITNVTVNIVGGSFGTPKTAEWRIQLSSSPITKNKLDYETPIMKGNESASGVANVKDDCRYFAVFMDNKIDGIISSIDIKYTE